MLSLSAVTFSRHDISSDKILAYSNSFISSLTNINSNNYELMENLYLNNISLDSTNKNLYKLKFSNGVELLVVKNAPYKIVSFEIGKILFKKNYSNIEEAPSKFDDNDMINFVKVVFPMVRKYAKACGFSKKLATISLVRTPENPRIYKVTATPSEQGIQYHSDFNCSFLIDSKDNKVIRMNIPELPIVDKKFNKLILISPNLARVKIIEALMSLSQKGQYIQKVGLRKIIFVDSSSNTAHFAYGGIFQSSDILNEKPVEVIIDAENKKILRIDDYKDSNFSYNQLISRNVFKWTWPVKSDIQILVGSGTIVKNCKFILLNEPPANPGPYHILNLRLGDRIVRTRFFPKCNLLSADQRWGTRGDKIWIQPSKELLYSIRKVTG